MVNYNTLKSSEVHAYNVGTLTKLSLACYDGYLLPLWCIKQDPATCTFYSTFAFPFLWNFLTITPVSKWRTLLFYKLNRETVIPSKRSYVCWSSCLLFSTYLFWDFFVCGVQGQLLFSPSSWLRMEIKASRLLDQLERFLFCSEMFGVCISIGQRVWKIWHIPKKSLWERV